MSSENIIDIINTISTHHIIMITTGLPHFIKTMKKIDVRVQDGTFGVMHMSRPKNLYNAHIRMLMCLPSMGEYRARSIISKYGSVQAALTHMGNLDVLGVDKLQNTWIRDLTPITKCPCGNAHQL